MRRFHFQAVGVYREPVALSNAAPERQRSHLSEQKDEVCPSLRVGGARCFLIRLALQFQSLRQISLRIGTIRFEADRFLKLADRFVDSALVEEDHAEVIVGPGIIRLGNDHPDTAVCSIYSEIE